MERIGPLAEYLLSQRVGGKQAITSRVPIGRVTRIGGMIDDGDADGIALLRFGIRLLPIEQTPVAAGRPGAVPFAARRSEVIAGDIGAVAGSYFGDIALVIDELPRGSGWDLQFAGHAQAQQAVLGVVEYARLL